MAVLSWCEHIQSETVFVSDRNAHSAGVLCAVHLVRSGFKCTAPLRDWAWFLDNMWNITKDILSDIKTTVYLIKVVNLT